MDLLIQIIFGWPAILGSQVISAVGIVIRKPWVVALGGLICIPFAFYLSGYQAVRFFAFLLPLFQFGSAWALRANRKMLAWILLFPLAGVSVVLAYLVLSQ
jgi:hypothetical protein